MKLIEKLFPKPIDVAVIHADFDAAQDRVLSECDKLLSELQIPTETKVENKARMLTDLGFVNSEPVKQLSVFKKQKEEIERVIAVTKQQATYIRQYMQTYPLEKFIPVSEFERICKKYGLIHAPVANYIKDVPEKNVLEMKNRKPLDHIASPDKYNIISNIKFMHGHTEKYKAFVRENVIGKPIVGDISERKVSELCKEFNGRRGSEWHYYKGTVETIDKTGLFIAAPPSHFDLRGVSQKTKQGYFNVTTTEVKDPLVFEYCKGDIVRITTKWGTPDDKSYLDEGLIDERQN